MAGKAERYGVYKVSSLQNECIRPSDPFHGRLTNRDWVLCLGGGEYVVLRVEGYQVTGLAGYRFHSKPLGQPIRWHPTPREATLLSVGETIEAPLDLTTLIDTTTTSKPVPMLPDGTDASRAVISYAQP